MAKFCGKCGAKLDEATGLCPNCDADKLNERSEKPESVETPKPKQDMVSESEKPLSKKEAKKKRKADKKAKKKEKRAQWSIIKKTRRFLLKLLLTVLLLAILAVGVTGILTYLGLVDIPIISETINNFVSDTYSADVEKDIPETDTDGFIYYHSSEENIVEDADTGITFVNNELLITLTSANYEYQLEEYLQTIGGQIVGEITELAEYQILLNDVYSYPDIETLVKNIEQFDWVASASPNYTIKMDVSYTPNDKKWKNKWEDVPDGDNWGMEAIDAPGAWEYRNQLQNVNIGILDDMFDTKHEDLNFAEIPLGSALTLSAIEDGNLEWSSHGTHTSGTIAAVFDNNQGVTGVSTNVNLYGVSASGLSTAGYYSSQAWNIAFYYLIAEKNCSVINISMGYDQLTFEASRKEAAATEVLNLMSQEIERFLKILIDRNYQFVICKSSGNQNESNGNYQYFKKDSDDESTAWSYYSYNDYIQFLNGDKSNEAVFARYKDRRKEIEARLESGNVDAKYDILGAINDPDVSNRIIIVGAAENLGTHKEGGFFGIGGTKIHDGYTVAAFSQCGKRVDVIAPGVDIYSTIKNGYGKMSGTSMAAPHVAGVVGLLFSANPSIEADNVKEIISTSAVGNYGHDGYGLINAKNAVEAALNYDPDEEVPATGGTFNQSDLPAGAVEFNGHYYYVYGIDTITDWNMAQEYCEEQGGYLATITSPEEDAFLYSYIIDAGYSSVMFGLTDQEQTDDWHWVTGEEFSYQNWRSGEPNYQGGYEHYGMYYERNTDGTWNDGSGKGGPFLCEWGEYQAVESATGIWEELIKSGKYTEYTKDWDQLNQMGISVMPTEYAILDIDGDGWEELILSGHQENLSEFGYYSVLACNKESKEITVIPIESPAQVLSGPVGQNFQGLQYSSQYHALMYTELNNGSMFGGYNFMVLDNNEIKPAFSVEFQCDSDANIRSYSMKEDGNSTAISEEEYDQYMEESKPIEFKPIPEPEPVRTTSDERDIVLVLDTSGSMSGTPMEETKKAATNFVNTILEEDASIGIVAYEDSAERLSDFSVDKNHLTGIVADISSGGGTNIESGLAEAKSMLDSSNAKKKIIVLMSDGEPNEGKEGEELIAYADELKSDDILIYTLGFFENMGGSKSSAQYLMEHLASDGCHYEVASADDLVFFFEDMADQINGQKYIYIRIACPVDVTVTYNGETLCSAEDALNVRTNFGTLTFEDSENEISVNEDDRIKVLRLKEGADYDVQIVGTGRGLMDYTIGFMDENGDYSDFRRFEDIKITKQTVIDTVAAVSDESVLNIDEDGDGKYDLKLRAEENGYGEEIKTPVWIYVGIGGGMVLLLIVVLVMVKIRKGKKKGMVKS